MIQETGDGVVATQQRAGDATGDATGGAATSPPPFDVDALLSRVNGDVALAKAMCLLFLDEYPALLAAVRQAVAQGDRPAIGQSAHALKGAVANFTTGEAMRAAAAIELMALDGTVDRWEPALLALDAALGRLAPALLESTA